MSRRRGFTLIESLAVIAIIGILASIVTVSVFAAQRQARDTRRKSDLTAISFGFEARFLAKTCSADVNTYPVYRLEVVGRSGRNTWKKVSDITGQPPDACGSFSDFMKTIPTDLDNPFQFNLSADKKHFRLAAKLEKTSQSADEYTQQNRIWQSSDYNGQDYVLAINGAVPYNYFIGR